MPFSLKPAGVKAGQRVRFRSACHPYALHPGLCHIGVTSLIRAKKLKLCLLPLGDPAQQDAQDRSTYKHSYPIRPAVARPGQVLRSQWRPLRLLAMANCK